MTAKVLITGASGFVGRQVLSSIIKRGYTVRAVLRNGTSTSEAEVLHTPDLFSEDVEWWARACAGVDAVIHVAWYVKWGKYLHATENLSCLIGSLALAQGAMRARVRRFVGVGTCFEYDLSKRVLGTDTPLKPETPYAACKAATYLTLSQLLPQAGMSFAWCRLFYLYGKGENSQRLVPYLHAQLSAGEPVDLTSGRQVRDFLDVAKAGTSIARTALGDASGPVNICSGVPVTVRQLAEHVADGYGRRDLLRFGARPDNLFDPDCVLGIPSDNI